MSAPCNFCDREVNPSDRESHAGNLCGSCWEVCYRIRELVKNPAFREFLQKTVAADNVRRAESKS